MYVRVGVVSEALQVLHYKCHDLKYNYNIELNVLFQCNCVVRPVRYIHYKHACIILM